MELQKLFITMVMVSIFVFSILQFTIIMQTDNGATEIITDNQIINTTFNDLLGNLSAIQGQSQTTSDVFSNITPNEDFGVWQVTPIVPQTKLFKALTIGTYNIIVKLPMQVLGVSPIVASVISGILLLLIILGVWRIWKGVISTR